MRQIERANEMKWVKSELKSRGISKRQFKKMLRENGYKPTLVNCVAVLMGISPKR